VDYQFRLKKRCGKIAKNKAPVRTYRRRRKAAGLALIAPAVKYTKLLSAIAAEAAPTNNRDIRSGRSGFSRDNPCTV
jgi:hypothetical protein